MGDRFGLGWRPPLAAAIFSRLSRIDVLEVLADDLFEATARERRGLRSLGAEVPLVLHGVGMGLASATAVDQARLDAMARLAEDLRPESWSEHLAFVRAGGIEIGHLAAPPRRAATLDGLSRNVERATRSVGTVPALENVASLIEPPGSDRDEARWLCDATAATGAPLLLDLHNLHTNAVNFGFDARRALAALPLERVTTVHIAGGRPVGAVGRQRWLDDHLHPVPDPVYVLLEDVSRLAPGALTVLLERDGAYPPIDDLMDELDRARLAVASGRRGRVP